ncbi:NAD(P)H-binding protein [Chitinophaga agrisoli]|uniref:NAD(P)H-binding protein n=1 Tax=Chitinophaga agrisoli TaxID=2607653 RepID=A0A5B2VXB6_9BACT|nr:NmrA family NAD(P)-binding protein [Chitinophaga agrisoli]KAA2243258.1 NAD(P)H-binding protein [Chitinophaga agrisoli]
MNTKKHTLVLGGNGKTGSRIAQRLTQLGWPVRIGSRSGSPAFDWEDQRSWMPALEGMEALYISFYPDLAMPGAVNDIRALTDLAVQSGVQHVVLLSGRGEKEAQDCEQIVMQCGIPWTVVRASWFSQNFSESYLLDPVLAGHVALPAGNVGEPFIDTDDIADVAVTALTQPGHTNQLYEVTGPRLLTFAEAIAIIAKATGRPIQFEHIPIEAYTATLREYQLPEDLVSLITYLFTEVLDGRNTYVTGDVERVLGRPARDFADYAQQTAASGAWAVPA